MNPSLSDIAVGGRRQLATAMALFATLFAGVGVLGFVGGAPTPLLVLCAVTLLIAGLLALAAWGVLSSIRNDLATARMDQAIDRVLAEHGALTCDCGHEHDAAPAPPEQPCAHDGTGADCAHNCDTCVFAARREAPSVARNQQGQS